MGITQYWQDIYIISRYIYRSIVSLKDNFLLFTVQAPFSKLTYPSQAAREKLIYSYQNIYTLNYMTIYRSQKKKKITWPYTYIHIQRLCYLYLTLHERNIVTYIDRSSEIKAYYYRPAHRCLDYYTYVKTLIHIEHVY